MINSFSKLLCLAGGILLCVSASAQQKANYPLAEKFRLLTQGPIAKYSTDISTQFINNTDCTWVAGPVQRILKLTE